MNEIMIDLQGGAKAPLYEKIYEYILTIHFIYDKYRLYL